MLLVWAYEQKHFFGRRKFFFASKCPKCRRYFSSLGVCFVLFGGVFVLWGCFVVFRASARFFLASQFCRPTIPKRGIPALQGKTAILTIHDQKPQATAFPFALFFSWPRHTAHIHSRVVAQSTSRAKRTRKTRRDAAHRLPGYRRRGDNGE